VWTDEQLAAFPLAGRAARLVTTRNPSLAGGGVVVPVRVDQMSQAQALALLRAGLPPLPDDIAAALTAETGRWPLLLRLASKVLADQVKLDPDITTAAEKLLGKLRQGGKLGIGMPTEAAGRQLDVADPVQRTKAVRATIEASTGLLRGAERDRLAELAVFAEDEDSYLAALLAEGPRRLLVIDDVWTDEQLAAFPVAGRCARLVTTRFTSLGEGSEVARVRVDEMSEPQAMALLGAGLSPLPRTVSEALLRETGRWPLLLRLVNKVLLDQARFASDEASAGTAVGDMLRRLRKDGKLQMDQLTGTEARRLDVADPDQRNRAVSATIQASVGLLTSADRDRLAELAVFAEDETIPFSLVTVLWQGASGMDRIASGTLCARLADLALLTPAPGGMVTMHDVIRDYLCGGLGAARLEELHRLLLDTVSRDLPEVRAATESWAVTAWWELPDDARYLREHLIEHLVAARRGGQAEETATDLRWVTARLRLSGPAGPYADLAVADTPRAERLRLLFGQAAHLLAPTDPPHSQADILYSRVAHDPDWGPQATAQAAARPRPALASAWSATDPPHPAVRRTLAGHTMGVESMAIASDGTWLATTSRDRTIRIWDAATGQCRATLAGHTGGVRSVAIAPDGTWLATTSRDGTARIWDAATGQCRATLTDHAGDVLSVAIAPDGTWLATADQDLRVDHPGNLGGSDSWEDAGP
jgi:hypothetical protein